MPLLDGAHSLLRCMILDCWMLTTESVKLINSRFCLIVMRELGNLDIGRGKEKMHTQAHEEVQFYQKFMICIHVNANYTQQQEIYHIYKFSLPLCIYRVFTSFALLLLLLLLLLQDFLIWMAWSWLMHAWIIYSGPFDIAQLKHLGMGCCWLRWMP